MEGALFLEPRENDEYLRRALLWLLYVCRRDDVDEPGLGVLHFEQDLGCGEGDLEFHLWYLTEKGWVERTENGAYAITVDGVDKVTQGVVLRADRLLSKLAGGQDALHRLEHFQCYPILDSEPEIATEVGLLDQFNVDGAFAKVKVRTAVRFCNPTRKIHRRFDAGVRDIRQHLTMYSTFPQAGPRRIVAIRNQFDEEQFFELGPADTLCVPTQKLEVDAIDDLAAPDAVPRD